MHVIALALLLTATIQGLATPLRDQVKSLVNKRLSKSLVDRYLSKSLTLADKINQVDDYGCNALHYAAEFGDLSLVKFLINNGANTKAENNNGLLPLDYAISEAEEVKSAQQMLIVSYILEETHGINGRDDQGWPPIYWAILAGNLKRVNELIDKGTSNAILFSPYDPSSSTPRSAFILAMDIQEDDIIKLLTPLAHKEFISVLVSKLRYRELEQFVKMGADLNSIYSLGKVETALTIACSGFRCAGDESKHFKYLMDLGTDINASNHEGETPLLIIARKGSQELVDLLLDLGADITHKNNAGETVVDIVEKRRKSLSPAKSSQIRYKLELLESYVSYLYEKATTNHDRYLLGQK